MADVPRITRFDRERAIIRGGHWAQLSQLQKGVLFVLLVNSHFETGRVQMSINDIAQHAGTKNLNRARRAYQDLETLGLCRTVSEGGGWGHTTIREVLCPPPLTGQTSGTVRDPEAENNRDAPRPPTTGTVSERYRDAQRTDTGPPSVPPIHISHKTNTSSNGNRDAARPPSPQEEEVVNFLRERGVWEWCAKKIAARITLDDAQRIYRELINDKSVKVKGDPSDRKARGGPYHHRLCQFAGIPVPNRRNR